MIGLKVSNEGGIKMKNPLNRKVPFWALILSIILSVSLTAAVVFWVGRQITTITVPPIVQPSIVPSELSLTIPVNFMGEYNFTIYNPNKVPILVNSLWTISVNDTIIAKDKYSVDDLQQFLWVRHISTSPVDQYGIDITEYDLIIPPEGYTIYTIVFHIPLSYIENSEVKEFKYESTVKVEWNPKLTVWTGAFYDGIEEWDNVFVPSWYPWKP